MGEPTNLREFKTGATAAGAVSGATVTHTFTPLTGDTWAWSVLKIKTSVSSGLVIANTVSVKNETLSETLKEVIDDIVNLKGETRVDLIRLYNTASYITEPGTVEVKVTTNANLGGGITFTLEATLYYGEVLH